MKSNIDRAAGLECRGRALLPGHSKSGLSFRHLWRLVESLRMLVPAPCIPKECNDLSMCRLRIGGTKKKPATADLHPGEHQTSCCQCACMEQQIRSVAAVPATSERFVPKAINQQHASAGQVRCLLGRQERSTKPPAAHLAHRASWRAMEADLWQQESALEAVHLHLGPPSSSLNGGALPRRIRWWQFFVAKNKPATTTRENNRANPRKRTSRQVLQ